MKTIALSKPLQVADLKSISDADVKNLKALFETSISMLDNKKKLAEAIQSYESSDFSNTLIEMNLEYLFEKVSSLRAKRLELKRKLFSSPSSAYQFADDTEQAINRDPKMIKIYEATIAKANTSLDVAVKLLDKFQVESAQAHAKVIVLTTDVQSQESGDYTKAVGVLTQKKMTVIKQRMLIGDLVDSIAAMESKIQDIGSGKNESIALSETRNIEIHFEL